MAKGDIVVTTRTQEQFDELMMFLEKKGIVWSGGDPPRKHQIWNSYKSETCIYIEHGRCITYCDLDYFMNRSHEPYEIVSFEEYMEKNNPNLNLRLIRAIKSVISNG